MCTTRQQRRPAPPTEDSALRPQVHPCARPARWRRNKYAACGRLGPAGPPLPVVEGPLPLGLLQGLVHGLLALLARHLGQYHLPLGLWLSPYAGEVEPLDVSTRRCRSLDHLPAGDLLHRQYVACSGRWAGPRGTPPLRFGLERFFFLEALAFFSLGVPEVTSSVGRDYSPCSPGFRCCAAGTLLLGFSAWAIACFWTCPGRFLLWPVAASGLLVGLQQLHVAVHLPGPVLHQLHHLTHGWIFSCRPAPGCGSAPAGCSAALSASGRRPPPA